ncbi:MAG: MBOAT family protein [Lachnospiraceae bacterium]|nr:MBOAT family protein [Lachnospiraceae bacterium]
MVFSSLTFLLLFLPVSLGIYYLVPMKAKNAVLVAVSLIFYAWGEPIYVLLMIYSILMNYGMGRLMEKENALKKPILVFTVFLNLLMLGFFKYSGFLVTNVNRLLPENLRLTVREIKLPIGISFYTFQALSYIIDLYRGKFKAQRNLIRFAAYITMFPQLIAGPIVRYEEVERQLTERTITLERFGRGMLRFICGLGKKVLLANTAGVVFDTARGLTDASAVGAWLGTAGYAFQIYFDFSGYSDMAIGLGQMLGFDFAENFDYPYISASVTEFWRRWHISLGTWFKEYVYIPLGGNRVSTARHVLNLMIVWLLTGIWHGAGWTFLLWGLYYGILLILDKYLFSRLKIPRALGIAGTMLLVLFGWVLFSSDGLSDALRTYGQMIGIGVPFVTDGAVYTLLRSCVLLVIEILACLPLMKKVYRKITKARAGQIVMTVAVAAVLLLSIVFLVTENYNPFLYFRF